MDLSDIERFAALVAITGVWMCGLTRVHNLSSTAVASFLWAHRICRARGGLVVLRGANRRTLDLLRRTGLERVLRLDAERDREVA